MHRARVWFAAHGITRIERIVTDNGACYRANDFAHVLHGARHQRIKPYTPRHNGKVCEDLDATLYWLGLTPAKV